ncbi:M28 family peptidase [Bacteroidota bacterium]
MKRLFVIAFIVALLLPTSFTYSQDNVVKKIIEIGTTDNQAMDHLDFLTNRFGGRLIGSDAYDNAAEWCAAQFRKWGMKAVLHEAGELPVGFNRGPWFGRMLGTPGMKLHFVTPSYTSGTKGVQKGHVMLEPKTRAEFERMKGKLKGSWVLITGESHPGWAIDYSENGDKRRAKIMEDNLEIEKENAPIMAENRANRRNPNYKPKELKPLKDTPALFYKEMREAGILGIIQSAKVPLGALYDRNCQTTMTFDNLPTVPDIKLDEHQYKIIKQMCIERRVFELEFDIRNHFKMGPVKYHNVIGIIPGTEYPDEYVIMGGHLDAFDVATGGVDCGSGTTPAMEAARLIMEAGGKPKRTIIVGLWAGEEFGLLGSKAWVLDNKDKHAKISNYFNRDGGPTVANSISVPKSWMEDMKKICEPLNSINPDFPFTLKETGPLMKRGGGSDHTYFVLNDVPAAGFGTGDPKGYDFDYREIWHTERDLYNKSIPEYQEHTAVVTAVVVLGVANLDHLLSRDGYYVVEEDVIEEPSKKEIRRKKKEERKKKK